jgi:secondary thiamine-phosphate synthase enzyme
MSTTLIESAGMKVMRRSFAVQSEGGRQAIDITQRVRDIVREAEVHDGLVFANCLHTTCSVLIIDSRPELFQDLSQMMGRFIEDECQYKHNDPRLSDCERGNATAHLRASLLGHGVAIGISDGELVLDGSQSILLAEWDGPRPRNVHVQIMGV